MPYRLLSFDGVPLPKYVPKDDLSVPEVPSALVGTLGQDVDFYGTVRKSPKNHTIRYEGAYFDDTYADLTDGTGQLLLSARTNGSYLLAANSSAASVQRQSDIIKGKIGVLGRLYRQEEDARQRQIKANLSLPLASRVNPDTVGLQWKLARMIEAIHDRQLSDLNKRVMMNFRFESAQRNWKSETQTVGPTAANIVGLPSGANDVVSNVRVYRVYPSGSENILDMTLTLTPLGSTVTRVAITRGDITLTLGENTPISAAPGLPIQFDMGKQTVTYNGNDYYNNLTVARQSPGWISLQPRYNDLVFEVSGGSVQVAWQYYDQWS